MQHRKTPELVQYHFDSLHELSRWIDDTRPRWHQTSSRTGSASRSWDLNAGYEGALEMAEKGWIEGAQKVQETLKVFNTATPKPDKKIDFYGYRPHVPRFCAGSPASMIRKVKVADSGAGRVLTLGVALAANAYTSAEAMSNFGVAIAQYVNQLESDGVRVEVIGCLTYTGGTSYTRLAHTVTIKRADQPLDLAVMAFAIGHPAMLRRLAFALIERSDVRERSGYGVAAPARVSDIINAPIGTVILNGMDRANTYAATPEEGYEYVKKQIDKTLEEL